MIYILNLHNNCVYNYGTSIYMYYTYNVFKLVKLWKAETLTYTKPALKIVLQNSEDNGQLMYSTPQLSAKSMPLVTN